MGENFLEIYKTKSSKGYRFSLDLVADLDFIRASTIDLTELILAGAFDVEIFGWESLI